MMLPLFLERVRLCKIPALAVAIAAVGQGAIAIKVSALEFQFGFSEGTPAEVIQGFNEAGELWSSFLNDDLTINLEVRFEAFDSSSLGRFEARRANFSYRDVLRALQADISSPDDAVAYSFLPKSPEFDVLLNTDIDFDLLINGTADNPNGVGSLTPYLDADGDCNNRSIRITTANAKALGLPSAGSGNCRPDPANARTAANDGLITLNSLYNWDFDASDGIDSESYDFVGIAAQGIAVMMGFISGVDVLDLNSPQVENGELVYFEDGRFPFVSLIDLYRFSEESSNLGVIDWTTGRKDNLGQEVDKYFSINGGQTKIASFSTGRVQGDGYRASSWKADEIGDGYVGLLEPTPGRGQVLEFTDTDQKLFDVIGWDLIDPLGDPPGRDIKVDDPDDPTDPPDDDGEDPGDGGEDPGDGGEDPGDGGEDPGDGGEDPGDGGEDPGDGSDPTDPVTVPEPSSAIGLLLLVWATRRWLPRYRQRSSRR